MKKIGKSSWYLTLWCYFLNKEASSLTNRLCLLCNDSWLVGKNRSFFFYEETFSWEGCKAHSHLEQEDKGSCNHIPPQTPSISPGHPMKEVLQLCRQLIPAALRWPFLGSWKGFFPTVYPKAFLLQQNPSLPLLPLLQRRQASPFGNLSSLKAFICAELAFLAPSSVSVSSQTMISCLLTFPSIIFWIFPWVHTAAKLPCPKLDSSWCFPNSDYICRLQKLFCIPHR